MGEQAGFVKFNFNSLADVQSFNAGKEAMVRAAVGGYVNGVAQLQAAALAGDKVAEGVALAQIAEVGEHIKDLTSAVASANAFVASQEGQPV